MLEVDHVEPGSLNPDRAMDPTNLLPACGTCNGPTGKWDYHPQKLPRKKCPKEDHGFHAIDPRRDDVAALYEVHADGDLRVRPGSDQARALWNRDVLFRLNRPKLKKWRQQTLDLVEVAEQLTEGAVTAGESVKPEAVRRRDVLVREVAYRLLFIELFEIPLTNTLRTLACGVRDAERGPAPT